MLFDVGGVMAVQGVPDDRECHAEKLERDCSLDSALGAVLGVADAGLVLGFFKAHFDRPPVCVAFDEFLGGGAEVGGDQRELIARWLVSVLDEQQPDGGVAERSIPQARP